VITRKDFSFFNKNVETRFSVHGTFLK